MNMTYTIQNKNLDKNRVFILQKSELEKRLDPLYYANKVVIKNAQKVSSFVNIRGGKRIPKGLTYSFEETDYKYLRVDNIKEYGTIEWQNLKSISAEIFNILERYKITKDDVIISIAGTVGKVATIDNEIDNVILTENCAKLIIKEKSKLLPKYLQILLELSTSKKQIQSGFIQTTIPKLGLDKIEEIKVPEIPSIEKQKHIVEIYENAYPQKKRLETQAEQLLSSIDDYLLDELGISLSDENTVNENISLYGFDLNKQNSLVQKGRLFLTGAKEIEKRFDPQFYLKYYAGLLSALKKSPYEKSALGIYLSEINYGASVSNNYAENGIPLLRIKDLKRNEINVKEVVYLPEEMKKALGNCFVKENDFLISRSGTIGIVSIVSKNIEGFAFGSFMIKFSLKENSNIDRHFLLYYLNSSLLIKLIEREKIGAIQGNITIPAIKNFPLILPSLERQKEISNHIQNIRKSADELKVTAKKILQQAKAEIEILILGK
jgi:restriction endonuclease S subunit